MGLSFRMGSLEAEGRLVELSGWLGNGYGERW